jgi:hypothetical protein
MSDMDSQRAGKPLRGLRRGTTLEVAEKLPNVGPFVEERPFRAAETVRNVCGL